MKGLTTTIFLLGLIITNPHSVNAVQLSSASATPVSATIVDQSFASPQLIAPSDGSVTKNPQEPFSWRRPSPLPRYYPLDHYDLYLDGALLAQGIKDDLTLTQEYYYYFIERKGDIFNLFPKFNMAEGYHTWNVVAYNTGEVSSGTGIWKFYIDSQIPYIKLISADNNRLSWDSRSPNSIPSIAKRYLYVGTDPLLTGEVEPGANLQFTLLCPQGVPSCDSITQTFNYSDGKFSHRFSNLLPNKAYAVYLSVTDSAGNSYTFPVFYLIHFLGGPLSFIIPPALVIRPPEAPLLPQPTGVITPPSMSELFPPSEFLPVPPPSPTPPPTKPDTLPSPHAALLPFILAFILIIFGLPTHLAMSQFGTATPLPQTIKFILILLFPFIGNKKYQTHPFTTLEFFNPVNSLHIKTVISDINGRYSLPPQLPKTVFVKAGHHKRLFKPSLISSDLLPKSCIYLYSRDHQNTLERLQQYSMNTRSIPLFVGTITSSISLLISPTHIGILYLYLCLQATFSEYIYLKILTRK